MAQRLDVQYVQFYTEGSAARKVAPRVPLKTIRLPKIKKLKPIVLRVDPVAIAGIVVATLMLVLMFVGVAQLNSTRQELTTMSAYVENLRVENELLEDTFHKGYDIEQVESTALAIGLVPKEQVKHVTVQVPETVTEDAPGTWERFYIFLTGLFA